MEVNAQLTPKSVMESLRRLDSLSLLTSASIVRQRRNDQTNYRKILVRQLDTPPRVK